MTAVCAPVGGREVGEVVLVLGLLVVAWMHIRCASRTSRCIVLHGGVVLAVYERLPLTLALLVVTPVVAPLIVCCLCGLPAPEMTDVDVYNQTADVTCMPTFKHLFS